MFESAPDTTADIAGKRPVLLIAAHGERGGGGRNERLKALAELTANNLPKHEVTYATIAGEPRLDDVLEDLRGRRISAYPFFMANGYFVDDVLTAKIAAVTDTFDVQAPLGVNPDFVSITARLLAEPLANGFSSVLIVAHGSSKDARSRLAAEDFSANLSNTLPGVEITCCYLEEPPFANDAVSAIDDRTIIVSLFAGDGLHAAGDLPEIMEKHRKTHLPVVTPASEIKEIARMIASGQVEHN